LADLRVLGAREILDEARLAALRLAEEPEKRHRCLAAQLGQPLVQLLIARRRRKPAFQGLEHATAILHPVNLGSAAKPRRRARPAELRKLTNPKSKRGLHSRAGEPSLRLRVGAPPPSPWSFSYSQSCS